MSKRRSQQARNKQRSGNAPMLFSSRNYLFLGIGLLLVLVGFTAMYLENEVEGFISLFISPLLIIAGYGVAAYAVMTHKQEENGNSSPSAG